ncbi:MAG: glycoside hydrolase family 6 protein [Solirubrobacteraceae bacterium]
MSLCSRLPKLLFALLAVAAGLATAWSCDAWAAGGGAPGSVSLDAPAYTAHEDQGALEITIERSGDLAGTENVGYGVKRQDGQPGIDFDTVANHEITFAPGQRTYTFTVPIMDRGMNATPVHALAYLYGSSPDALGPNHNAPVTILHDDPLQARDPANPLGVPGPYDGNPVAGARLYVDPDSAAAEAQRRLRRTRPRFAALLGDLAHEPGAHRFYMWNMGGQIAGRVAHYLENAQVQQPETTVMLSTYSLVHGACGSTATPAVQARFDDFIRRVAEGIGNFHVVFFLEIDSLITAPCLTRTQLAIREAELSYAVGALEADPHVLVYLDGGAADAVHAARMARYLRASGLAQAQGFFLNSTHFDWSTTEIHYGQRISALTGGAHFIVNTGSNGHGPLHPVHRVRQGNEILCNPPGRGLGPLTLDDDVAQQTPYLATDGLLWFSNPGGSGGPCVRGAPPRGAFWPARAVMLARNWVDRVTGPRFPLRESPFAAMRRNG